jgi:hypothetical protein
VVVGERPEWDAFAGFGLLLIGLGFVLRTESTGGVAEDRTPFGLHATAAPAYALKIATSSSSQWRNACTWDLCSASGGQAR